MDQLNLKLALSWEIVKFESNTNMGCTQPNLFFSGLRMSWVDLFDPSTMEKGRAMYKDKSSELSMIYIVYM